MLVTDVDATSIHCWCAYWEQSFQKKIKNILGHSGPMNDIF